MAASDFLEGLMQLTQKLGPSFFTLVLHATYMVEVTEGSRKDWLVLFLDVQCDTGFPLL